MSLEDFNILDQFVTKFGDELGNLENIWKNTYDLDLQSKRKEDLVKNSVELLHEFFQLVKEEEKAQIELISQKIESVSQQITKDAQSINVVEVNAWLTSPPNEILYNKMNRLIEAVDQLQRVIKLYKALEQLPKKGEEMPLAALPVPLTLDICLKEEFIELLNTEITKFASDGSPPLEKKNEEETPSKKERPGPKLNVKALPKPKTMNIKVNKVIYPPVVEDKSNVFYHQEQCNDFPPVQVQDVKDIYLEKYMNKVHSNYMGSNKTKDDDFMVVSILKTALKCSCLATDKRGSTTFEIDFAELKKNAPDIDLSNNTVFDEAIVNHLSNVLYSKYSFYHITQPNFAQEFKMIETKHPQKKQTFKIAMLYSNGTEKTLHDYFAHRETDVTPAYVDFLDILGEKINLKGWKNYRGDIGAEIEQNSYYTKWKNIEVMFHISHWMIPEQHRRLLGNDVNFIVFHDSPEPFYPAPLNELGTVPQVFGVVTPFDDLFRVAFFTRPSIGNYDPPIPANYFWTRETLKDFLFCKAYNGYCQALKCPPMNRLYELPRGSAIADLAKRFPEETGKAIKKKEKTEKIKQQMIKAASVGDPLLLMVKVMTLQNVTTKLVSPIVIIKNSDEVIKTGPSKSPKGEWNEMLCFNVMATDPATSLLVISLSDENIVLGVVELSFADICGHIWDKKPFVVDLFHSTGCQASLNMSVNLVGPGSTQCPACHLFLGDLPVFTFESTKYHARCVSCQFCSSNLCGTGSTISFKVRKENDIVDFSCFKCYAKKIGDNVPCIIVESEGNVTNSRHTGTSPHSWEKSEFLGGVNWCGFCGDTFKAKINLNLKSEGYLCSSCKYSCHVECMESVPSDCTKDPNKSVIHSGSPSSKVSNMIGKATLRKSIGAKRKSIGKDSSSNIFKDKEGDANK